MEEIVVRTVSNSGLYESSNGLPAIAHGELLEQRMKTVGAGALSDTELLAVLIGVGRSENDAMSIAAKLMTEAGSIVRMASWTTRDFQRIKGIGKVKAYRFVAIVEIARRMIAQNCAQAPILGQADSVAEYLRPFTLGLEVEKFWVLCLNRKNRLIKRVEATSGTATNSLVHPREVFREAIREAASAIVCVHNHPSGDPTPSAADVQVTRQLRDAAKVVCIDLLDHVIIGQACMDPANLGFYSFRSAGVM
jgi:DNA repair protein RadC